ncbi:LX12B protein, partial [Rhinopomastus cyanomelas]|nr:LX12B protein [Rhinopomastus cyanomelas]
MASYQLQVRTGCQLLAGTLDTVTITLVGTRGQSPPTPLQRWGPDLACGSCGDFTVQCPRPLGRLLLLRLHKGPFGDLPESSWYLEDVRVWRQG